ncbi:MAG: hypothetical protein WC389_03575 [Lutibacter sp.]|jgi:hypothetical protein
MAIKDIVEKMKDKIIDEKDIINEKIDNKERIEWNAGKLDILEWLLPALEREAELQEEMARALIYILDERLRGIDCGKTDRMVQDIVEKYFGKSWEDIINEKDKK